MNSDWSRTTRTEKPSGRMPSRSASRLLMFCTTATVLVPDCLRICSSTVGSPFTLATVRGLGHAVLDARHVGDAHRVAAHVAHHDVAELVRVLHAAARAHGDRLRAALHLPARHVHVLRLQRARRRR